MLFRSDYEDASKPHVYGETENPPVKGSDANMVTASMKMKQAEMPSLLHKKHP